MLRNQSYLLYDGLGSTTGLADASGNVTASYAYDVFGALRSGAPDATEWLFTGEQRDSESGLYYLRARYYDPDTGRFLSQDPVHGFAASPQTLNRYPYVGSNPTNQVDPTGLVAWIKGGGGGSPKEGGFKDFRGEWKVLVGKLASGRPHEWVKIGLWARVTWSGSGTEVYFSASREGSGVDVRRATVSYLNLQSRHADLLGCTGACLTDPGSVGSNTVAAGPAAGLPMKIQLDLSRSLDTDVGTFIGSNALTLDLQSGRASQNICIAAPWSAAWGNQVICR